MELRHLRYFCAVAEQLNLSRAAELLPVAQPALSRQMRDLEEELGAKLFVRLSNGIQLTDAGALFYQHATRILSQVSIAQTAVAELAKGNGGDFIIGGDWRIPVDLVPVAVRELRLRYPKVNITLVELPMHEQMLALRERRIHMGLLPFTLLSPDDAMESRPIADSELVALMPDSHPLAGEALLDFKQLEGDTWITLDEKSFPGGRQIFRRILKPFGVTPNIECVATTTDGVIARVATGEGIAVLPRIFVNGHLGHLRAIPLRGLIFQLCAVWPRHAASPLVPALLELVHGYLDEPQGAQRV